MSVRAKIALAVTTVTAFSLWVLFWISSTAVESGFAKIEQRDGRLKLEQAVEALRDEFEKVDSLAADWTAWYGSYQFVQNPNPEYIQTNLLPDTYMLNNLNLIALVRSDGTVVYAKLFDEKRGKLSDPHPEILKHLKRGGKLVSHKSVNSCIRGIVSTPEGLLAIASRPITTSSRKGPIRGALVMGRYLDAQIVQRIRRKTYMDVETNPWSAASPPADLQQVAPQLLEADSVVLPLNRNLMRAYALIKDIYGKPCAVVRVTVPRAVHAQMLWTKRCMSASIGLMLMLTGASIIWMLNRLVLNRIALLSKQVNALATAATAKPLIPNMGRDEVGSLAQSINNMLTALGRAEKRLQESELRYHTLFEKAQTGLLLIDLSTNTVVDANDTAVKLLGLPKEELVGKPCGKPLCNKRGDEPCDQNCKFQSEAVECTFSKPDGQTVTVLKSTIPILLERKQFLIVSIADVTALKQAENALREASTHLAHRTAQLEILVSQLQAEVMNRRRLEEELQAILQSVRCRIWHANVTMVSSERRVDFAWELRDFNEAAAQRVFPVQVKHGQTYNEAFREHIPEEDKLQMDKTSSSALMSGQSMYSQQFRWIGDDGQLRWLYEDVFIKPVGSGMWHVVGVCTDITEQKRIEEERSKLAHAVESTAEAIVITDAAWKVAYANPAFEKITGFDRQNVIGRHATELNLDEKAFKAAVEKAQQEKTWGGRMLCSKSDGSRYHADVNVSPVYSNDGKLTGYMLLMRDVSEELVLQQQLEQAQKMEAVGRLAGGIAHDFNNILTAIGGFANILASKLDREHPHRKYVEHIQNSVDKASALTRQLLAFSRKQVVEPKPLRLNEVVAGIEPMLRSIIGEDIVLTTILKEAVVTADPSQIEQIIMNLVVNSRDAMPQGGHLTIETSKVWLDEAYCQRHHDTTPGEYAMLAITDTGCGISPDVLPHIFEPFFTTKEKGKGTGLGLSTVYGIVKQNRGSVWVYSEVGKGTTVKVYLPLAKTAPVAEQKQAEPILTEVNGSETVLLVEDEQTVRLLAHEILIDRGYTVLEASNGEEAIQVSESYEDEIDILVTDVIMPGMSGTEVAEHLLRRRPKMKVLYMSGYTDNSIVNHGVLDSGVAYIQKPFTPDGLARKIREVLASEVPTGKRR